MSTCTEHDDAELLHQELGAGDPPGAGHGLAPQPDSWEAQLLVPAHAGHRCITHDRRGHGRSTRTSRAGGPAKAGRAPFLWTTGDAAGLPGEGFDEQCAASLADGSRGHPDVADGPFGADCAGAAPADVPAFPHA